MTGSDEKAGLDEWAHLGIAGKSALICASMFIAIGLFAMGSALPILETNFADSRNAAFLVQLIGGIVAPVFALASPIAGKLVTRFGVRTIYLASVALFVIGGVGPAICTSLSQIILFRVVLGIAVAGGFTAGMAGIARVPDRQRHLLYGFTSFVGGGICILVFPLVGVMAKESWRLAFLAHLILLPPALFALALPRHRVAPRAPERAIPGAAARLAGVPPQLLLLAAVLGWAMVASTLYSPFFLASIGITDPSAIGGILGAMSACSLVGSGSYGFLQKVLGTRGMLLAAPIMAGSGCLVISMSHVVPMAVAGLGLLAMGLAIFGAVGYAAAIEAIGVDGDSGAATGIVSLALYLPQIFFPMIASAIGASVGPAKVYLLLAMVLAAASAVVVVRPVTSAPSGGG